MSGAAPQTVLPIEKTVKLPTCGYLTLDIPCAFLLNRTVSFYILIGNV
jgi:hypothetical protein